MKIQTGNPVRADDFFKRENVIQQAWEYLESGSHILIAAPRRVGKTSLMYYLADHPKKDFNFVYIITESVNNENEFFRRILKKILTTDFVKKSEKAKTLLEKYKPSIIKIGAEGIEFGVSEDKDYFEMLSNVLKSDHPAGEKMVIMIDEFPETLENIIEDGTESAGKHFLQTNRELRQDDEISKNVQFIYTGSIGLENVVSRLNVMSTINDLVRLKVPPLKREEALDLIGELLAGVRFKLSKEVKNYILTHIEWLIPFYIQLIMQELQNISREDKVALVQKEHVDAALKGVLDQRSHFEHWHTRLRTTIKGKDYNFVKEVLNITAENGELNSNDIFNLAVKHEKEDTFKDFIGTLVYDGYINNNDDPHTYRFNSPILKMWWRQNVAN